MTRASSLFTKLMICIVIEAFIWFLNTKIIQNQRMLWEQVLKLTWTILICGDQHLTINGAGKFLIAVYGATVSNKIGHYT